MAPLMMTRGIRVFVTLRLISVVIVFRVLIPGMKLRLLMCLLVTVMKMDFGMTRCELAKVSTVIGLLAGMAAGTNCLLIVRVTLARSTGTTAGSSIAAIFSTAGPAPDAENALPYAQPRLCEMCNVSPTPVPSMLVVSITVTDRDSEWSLARLHVAVVRVVSRLDLRACFVTWARPLIVYLNPVMSPVILVLSSLPLL